MTQVGSSRGRLEFLLSKSINQTSHVFATEIVKMAEFHPAPVQKTSRAVQKLATIERCFLAHPRFGERSLSTMLTQQFIDIQ
jgi:hypothetical protein